MTTQAQIQGLGEFAHQGFTLQHPGDHILLLMHEGDLVACFSQLGATEESLQEECERHLVMKHGRGAYKMLKGGVTMGEFDSGIVFILTREDVITLAKEKGIPEEKIDGQFLKEIKDGVSSLVVTEVKRFMREIVG